MRRTITSHSPQETKELAARLAGQLSGGEVIVLSGDLGSGKTCFVQGLAAGLGVRGRVRSPSFIIMASYHGRLHLHHFDFYRLTAAVELTELGLEECYTAGAVAVIEWGEKFRSCLPRQTMWLKMEWRDENKRTLKFGRGFTADHFAGMLNA